MLTINKQDIVKTVFIIWVIATTGYVVWDQYTGYQVRGIQRAYNDGYAKSVDDLIAQTEKNGCQPFEVKKEDKQISLVGGQCLNQGQTQASQAPAPQSTLKK